MSLASLMFLCIALSATVNAGPVKRRAAVCNGYSQLCSRLYSNVTYIGAHDSYAIDSTSIDREHSYLRLLYLNFLLPSLTKSCGEPIHLHHCATQLGVRVLQSQAHLKDGHIELCHTGGSLLSYLEEVKTWLDANPNEVLTLVVTNPDAISVADYWGPDFVAAGLDTYAYVPSSSQPGLSDWPTLGSMIDSGKRLVVFMDYNSDTSSVPYILPEFSSVWETKYDVTDSSFPCTVDRGSTPGMLMANHFLDVSIFGILIPDRGSADITNSVSSIVANSNGCLSLNSGNAPTFILLDFVNQGQTITAGNILNGLT
ncbi:hypothetical protein BS47DRAFT_1333564 [Hydnum rufescens UP504]|uniref:PLC-like phosphodiesterase n=1 Tax=Hydnum rufescens UP504 TaxID=1448309 RepID=A0A9P6DQ43_9AGAM|nr:hypothetical protein BS47DRAFT_1333564 [Hydnum rufescens UP504]